MHKSGDTIKKINIGAFIGNIFNNNNNNLYKENKNNIIEKNMNNKYKIDDNYILDLSSKHLENELIKNLIIKYKNIIVLDLWFNEILDIEY